jgi:hypothetical protein
MVRCDPNWYLYSNNGWISFQTIVTVLLVTIAVGIIVGVGLIIYDIFRRRGIRIFQRGVTVRMMPQMTTETSFEAQIIRRKQRYTRGKDVVSFRSRFTGRLTNGFFANQIFTPEVVDGTRVYRDYFEDTTPNISEDKRSVISYCPDTIPYWEAEGNLNSDVDTDWKEWRWEIPEYSPLGNYKIKMMVWNTFTGNVKEPYRTIEDTFEVIDPNDSHYRRFDSVNINE